MTVGVVETTVPVANDIILGEFKAYYNYGKPSQKLIGATDGGCKIDIERKIREIKFDGAYGPCLDSDGVPLIRTDELIARISLEALYLKYFNKKIISDCESDGAWESNNWGATGGTYAAETSIVNSGNQSAKCSIASAQTGHGIHEVFSSVKDLTEFDNGETSVTGDYIGISVYITTAMLAILGTDSIQVRLHYDAEGTETNYHWYDIEASALTADQWTNLTIAKSSFTLEGSGDWDDITGISFEVPDETDDALEFYVDSIDLIQNHSYSAPIAINGSGINYTDETTYREITESLEILSRDYIDNITIVGQKQDGYKFKGILENCLNDGAISLALQEKKEVVNSTQFTAHFDPNTMTTAPIKMREYIAA